MLSVGTPREWCCCGGTYAWEVAIAPQHSTPLIEEVLEIAHGCYTKEDEADKMRESDMRDAVGWKNSYLPSFVMMVSTMGEAYLSRCSGDPFS